MKRSRIKTNVNNRIYDLLQKIHSSDKKRAANRYKLISLKFEYLENQL